jgi:3-oxoacyl-[acyl-carrier protein] reductase
MQLKDKVAVVTGAGRGIGRATALALAREGANLVLVARSEDQLDEVCNEVKKAGRDAIKAAADVSKKSDVKAMAKKALDYFGNIDILVNNAGAAVHNMIPDIREEDWNINMDVNAKGVFLCTQAFFSHMCSRGSGHIVNVLSMAGKRGGAKNSAYAASKFAAIGFTESTMNEGRTHGVRATAVCPGPTDTQLRAGNWPDDIKEQLLHPEDIAEVVVFVVTRPSRVSIPEVMVLAPLFTPKRS